MVSRFAAIAPCCYAPTNSSILDNFWSIICFKASWNRKLQQRSDPGCFTHSELIHTFCHFMCKKKITRLFKIQMLHFNILCFSVCVFIDSVCLITQTWFINLKAASLIRPHTASLIIGRNRIKVYYSSSMERVWLLCCVQSCVSTCWMSPTQCYHSWRNAFTWSYNDSAHLKRTCRSDICKCFFYRYHSVALSDRLHAACSWDHAGNIWLCSSYRWDAFAFI